MKICVLGCGAIGSNIAMQLGSIYKEAQFTLVDFDQVEERNVATQSYFLPHIKMKKAVALQIMMGLKVKKRMINIITHKIVDQKEVSKLMKEHDLVLDCFDNAESRKLTEGYNNVLHIGFHPSYTAEIIWGKNYTAPNNIAPGELDICTMESAVPFINLVVSLGVFAIQEYFTSNKEPEFIITHGFKITRLS